MSWTAYQIILRLHSPLHIGYREVGYLRRTRPYVTGRALRGALVNRVGRNQDIRGEDPGDPFRAVSKTFAQYLTFTRCCSPEKLWSKCSSMPATAPKPAHNLIARPACFARAGRSHLGLAPLQ